MIKLVGVKKTHINNRKSHVEALKGVNLTLGDTGFVLLRGENGSGKTTLLSILGGLDSVTEGQFFVGETDYAKLSQRKLDDWRGHDVAYMFQEYNLISDYTVRENIRLGRTMPGGFISNDEIDAILKLVGLEGFGDRFPKDLSGGEQQKVALARALVKNPKVILVDEPTSQIDAGSSEMVLKILKDISKSVLVVCISHNEEKVMPYADRVVEIKGGMIISDTMHAPKHTAEKTKKAVKSDEVVTTVSEQKVSPDSTKIKRVRSRFAFDLGIKHIWEQRNRSLIIVMLTTFSLVLFTSSIMLLNYNRYKAYASNAFGVYNYHSFTADYISRNDFEKISNVIGEKFPNTNIIKYIDYAWGDAIFGIIETGSDAADNNELNVTITDYILKEIKDGLIPIYATQNSNTAIVSSTITGWSDVANKYLKIYDIPHQIVEYDATDYREVDVNSDLYRFKLKTEYAVVKVSSACLEKWRAKTIETATPTVPPAQVDPITNPVGAEKRRQYEDANTIKLLHFTVNKRDLTGNIKTGRIANGTINSTGLLSFDKLNALKDDECFASNRLLREIGILEASGSKFVGPYDLASNFAPITVRVGNGNEKTFKLVGINTATTNDIYVNDRNFFFDNESDDSFLTSTYFMTSKILLNAKSESQLAKIINFVENESNLKYESADSYKIKISSDQVDLVKGVLSTIAVITILITILTLYYLASAIITDRKRDIGVFRSLGARSTHIFAIFMISTFILAILASGLTIILSYVVATVVNALAADVYGYTVTIVAVTSLDIMLLLATCFVGAFLATLFPILKYSEQSPIKQIKK